MYKFLLTTSIMLCLGTQASTAQGRMGVLEGIRTLHARTMAKRLAQELTTMELDHPSALALRQINIVRSGLLEPSGKVLPPLAEVRVMLYEREAQLAATQNSRYYTYDALRKIIALAGNAAIVREHDNTKEQVDLHISSLGDAADFYLENVNELLDEPVILIPSDKEQRRLMNISMELREYNVRPEVLLDRLASRRKSGRKDLARTLQELSNYHSSTAQVHILAKNANFLVHIESYAEPLVRDWKDMSLLGLETKAMIYEFAARLAAAEGNGEKVQDNLQRVLNLNNDIDHVEMTVSLRGRKVVLSPQTIGEVHQLYLQIFSKQ